MSDKPTKASTEDLQQIQIIQQHQQILALQEQVLKEQIQKLQVAKQQSAMQALQFFAVFEGRYGFNPMKNPERLQPDGTINPPTETTVPESQQLKGVVAAVEG